MLPFGVSDWWELKCGVIFLLATNENLALDLTMLIELNINVKDKQETFIVRLFHVKLCSCMFGV